MSRFEAELSKFMPALKSEMAERCRAEMDLLTSQASFRADEFLELITSFQISRWIFICDLTF